MTSSSESFKAQLFTETDPDLRQAIGKLWVEAREFEAFELVERELGAKLVEEVQRSGWVTVKGKPITSWFAAPGVYSQQHCVRHDIRTLAWCGRPVPHSWGKLAPVPKPQTAQGNMSSKACTYCWRKRASWETWGDQPPVRIGGSRSEEIIL